MTTYALPTLSRAAPQDLEFGLKSNTQVSVSELSGDVQTVELPGARWTMSFRYNALEREDADKLAAWLISLRGQGNRARVPVFSRRAPRGTWAGSPVVNNNVGSPSLSQTGDTLWASGFSPFATVKAGDLFNIGTNGQLCMVRSDGTADSNGWLQLSVEPPIRSAPAHGTALVTTDVVVPLMILSDPHVKWIDMPGDLRDVALDLIEVFA